MENINKKYLKFIMILILLTCIVIFFININPFITKDSNAEIMIRASLYDTNAINHTYYFVLYSDRRLEVDLIERRSSKGIESNKFVNKILKKKSKKLTKYTYQKIIDHAKVIQKPDYEVEVQDGDMMEVYYKGKVYKDTYLYGRPSELHDLMHEFIKMSLIPINFNNTVIKN